MIVLKNPQNGEKIDLLTEEQIKFLESDRSQITVENFDYLDLKVQADQDCSLAKEVRFEWEAEGESTVQISESEDFSEYYSQTGNNCCDIANFKCNTKYFWRVVCGDEISDTFCFYTEDKYPRFITVGGITNVRDFGGRQTVDGRRIRQGLLYRGSEMHPHLNITDDGMKTMKEVLKIKSILDLRGSTEVVEDVYHENYINVPTRGYITWFENPDATKQIFEFLADEKNYPIYFHCWGGADRTGTVAFLAGALLGQSYDALVDEYEITTLSIWGVRSRNAEQYTPFIDKINSFEGDTLAEKVKNHLLTCGVAEEAIEKFRNIMLV